MVAILFAAFKRQIILGIRRTSNEPHIRQSVVEGRWKVVAFARPTPTMIVTEVPVFSVNRVHTRYTNIDSDFCQICSTILHWSNLLDRYSGTTGIHQQVNMERERVRQDYPTHCHLLLLLLRSMGCVSHTQGRNVRDKQTCSPVPRRPTRISCRAIKN